MRRTGFVVAAMLVGAMLVGAMLGTGTAVLAQAISLGVPGDVQRGQALAQRLCANCHAVGPKSPNTARADIPSFHSIASRDGTTAQRLAGAIIIPHPAMPGVQLTMAEIREIVVYILSLKGEK
jgi:cytochrome c